MGCLFLQGFFLIIINTSNQNQSKTRQTQPTALSSIHQVLFFFRGKIGQQKYARYFEWLITETPQIHQEKDAEIMGEI